MTDNPNSVRELLAECRERCECSDNVDAEQSHDGSFSGTFTRCLFCRIDAALSAPSPTPAVAGLVAELDALEAKATEGPWKWKPCDTECGTPISGAAPDDRLFAIDCGDYHGMNDNDAHFIAALRNAWPAIKSALEDAERNRRHSQPGEFVMVPRDVVEFLNGSGPLEGLWYGDPKEERGDKPPFWWRKYLNEAIGKLIYDKESRTIKLAAPPSPTPAVAGLVERLRKWPKLVSHDGARFYKTDDIEPLAIAAADAIEAAQALLSSKAREMAAAERVRQECATELERAFNEASTYNLLHGAARIRALSLTNLVDSGKGEAT